MATSQYASVRSFVTTFPSWVGNTVDAERVQAYTTYENIYWTAPQTFQLVMRGSNDRAIYLPSARTIVNATNRFLAKGWDYAVSPRVGSPNDQTVVQQMLNQLFKRERMWTKFSRQKLYGLIRGDAIWHIVGNDAMPQSRRISIYELDPGTYFPITDPENIEKVVGCHIVDLVYVAKKQVARRQTYRKTETGTITSELAYYELGKWDDRIDPASGEPREVKLVGVVRPPTELPPAITSIPVYHIPNGGAPGSVFGAAEIAGIESLLTSMNQAVSDEDMSLALQGLGLYVTTSGPPVNSANEETNWTLGPGEVVEIDEESDFKRVNGIDTVDPWLNHMRFVLGSAHQAIGIPEIAAGNIDVQVAESGISLYLQLSPLLAKNADKEVEMLSVYDQMLYDIVQMWLPAYEQLTAGLAVEVVSVVEDPMPVNREARIQEIITLATSTPPIISAEYARQELAKYGYEFPKEMGETIVAETSAYSSAAFPDPFTARVASEFETQE